MEHIDELLTNDKIIKMPNCWIVYIQPGGEANPEQQQLCLDKNCFGMGWGEQHKKDSKAACKAVETYKK